jgi:hypothetical protein
MENLKQLLSIGNRKLGKDIAIFNMQPAKLCSSEKLGLCKLCNKCYAKKAELIYPAVLPYRMRQMYYWEQITAKQFCSEFFSAISKKKTAIKYLRISESGDFNSQLDVNKLEQIAEVLSYSGIVTYCYTARKDLNFSECRFLVVNASNFESAGISNQFIGVKGAKQAKLTDKNNGIHSYVCAGDCRKCNLCTKKTGKKIYCEIH